MSADIELKWEWPAERTVEERILIKVDKIKLQSSGFFGIRKSPSLAASIPGPTVVFGVIQGNNKLTAGKTLSVVVPKLEIEPLNSGGYAVLGLVETDICICIVPVKSANIDISSVNCP